MLRLKQCIFRQVLGEPFSWEQASDMTFKDIFKAMRMYRAALKRLLEGGAEEAGSAAHAELLQLLALKVSFCTLPCIMPLDLPLHISAGCRMWSPGRACEVGQRDRVAHQLPGQS